MIKHRRTVRLISYPADIYGRGLKGRGYTVQVKKGNRLIKEVDVSTKAEGKKIVRKLRKN